MADSFEQGQKELENTAQPIWDRMRPLFGEEITDALEREEITDQSAIEDLARRDADAPIYIKLGFTYGKAVKFKKEFGREERNTNAAVVSSAVKPRMADRDQTTLSIKEEESVMATEKWGPKYPKFNTPQMRAELKNFSEEIASACRVPEAAFNEEGISKHIQDNCNEQRRYNKLKNSKALDYGQHDLDTSASDEASICGSTPSKSDHDDPGSGHETSDHDTDILEDSSGESPVATQPEKPEKPENQEVDSWPLRSNQVIVKAVFGKLLTRESTVLVLKKKFSVQSKHVVAMTPGQLLAVLAKKLVNSGYCKLKKERVKFLTRADVSVCKQIEL